MSKPTKRPSLPPANDPSFLSAVRETLQGLTGERGEKIDRAVSFRDLLGQGVIAAAGKFKQLPTGQDPTDYLRVNIPAEYLTDPNAYFGNPFTGRKAPGQYPTTPSKVAGLVAIGGYRSVVISWSAPRYRPHSHTEIARSEINDFSTSTVIGGSPTGAYTDTAEGGKKYYYWARHVSRLGVEGNWTGPVTAETAEDAEYLAEELKGKVDRNYLVQSLTGEIDKIEGLEQQYTVKLDVNGRVAGFGLANNGESSVFAVAANEIYFVDPQSPNADFDPDADYADESSLFGTNFISGYATINGTPRYVFNVPVAIPDATITSAKIDEGFFENLTVAQKADLKDVTISGIIKSTKTVSGNPAWQLDVDGDLSLYAGSTGGSMEIDGDRIVVRDGNGNPRVIIGRL